MVRPTVIEVPLDSSGTSRGEERAPDALRAAGLLERVGAVSAVRTDAHVRVSKRDPTTGVIGSDDVRRATSAIAAALRDVVHQDGRALVVGGDCTLLLGIFSGLRGGTALWFVDGHADFLDGETSPTGEAADMNLAILTGHGPPGLLASGRLVDPGGVILLGHRPDELSPDAARENARIDPAIRALTSVEIRQRGARAVGEEIARNDPALPTWLHIDLDVLDEQALPAVTYPQPLGLDWADFAALVGPLAAADDLVGVSVADFNPDLDPNGEYARRVVDTIAALLS